MSINMLKKQERSEAREGVAAARLLKT